MAAVRKPANHPTPAAKLAARGTAPADLGASAHWIESPDPGLLREPAPAWLDGDAGRQLFSELYQQLRHIAKQQRRRMNAQTGHTTSLVHNVYFRLSKPEALEVRSKVEASIASNELQVKPTSYRHRILGDVISDKRLLLCVRKIKAMGSFLAQIT